MYMYMYVGYDVMVIDHTVLYFMYIVCMTFHFTCKTNTYCTLFSIILNYKMTSIDYTWDHNSQHIIGTKCKHTIQCLYKHFLCLN